MKDDVLGSADNPRAFPFAAEYGHPAACGGMTLRDYFAGQVLVGLLASVTRDATGFATIDGGGLVADCYKLADAMLAERTVKGRA